MYYILLNLLCIILVIAKLSIYYTSLYFTSYCQTSYLLYRLLHYLLPSRMCFHTIIGKLSLYYILYSTKLLLNIPCMLLYAVYVLCIVKHSMYCPVCYVYVTVCLSLYIGEPPDKISMQPCTIK